MGNARFENGGAYTIPDVLIYPSVWFAKSLFFAPCDPTGDILHSMSSTVVPRQHERFRKFWARLSKPQPQRRRRSRPGTAAELRRGFMAN